MLKVWLLICSLFAVSSLDARVNNLPDKTIAPVFGVLTNPIIETFQEGFKTNASHYIASSYVKFLEMSGARVVPILSNSTQAEVDQLLGWVNGVLFTGGDYPFWENKNEKPVLTPEYAATGCYIYEKVQEMYKQGKILPLWGTCLGFELIHICARNEFDTISNFTGMPAYNRRNIFTREARKSAIFSYTRDIAKVAMRILEKKEVSLLGHNYGISPKTYEKNRVLRDTFDVLSTMKDHNGNEFVAMIEAKNSPIFGVQFHPEKNSFEFVKPVYPHDSEGVFAMTFLSNFIVNLAKKNENVFPTDELNSRLIYNWPPVFVDYMFMTVIEFY